MSMDLVRAALMQEVKDFLTGHATITTNKGIFENLPTLDAENIAWENRNFDPDSKDFFATVNYVPNNPEGRTIGEGGYDEMSGFVQIDFDGKQGRGTGEHGKWEKKAPLFFITGKNFTYQGNSVIVISAGMSQGRVVGNNYRKSLTVAFRSQLKRHITT